MVRRCRTWLLMVVLMSGAHQAQAQDISRFHRVDPNLADVSYLGITIPMTMALWVLSPTDVGKQNVLDFDVSLRESLRWENVAAAGVFSDVLLYSVVFGAMATPALGELSLDTPVPEASMVAVEALSTTWMLSQVFNHLVERERPDSYFESGEEAYDAFFSGHTSVSFAAVTQLTLFSYELDWLSDETRWLVPTVGYSLAGLTGYLRVAADRHWVTDVLVGAVMGTAVSYLVFFLRSSE